MFCSALIQKAAIAALGVALGATALTDRDAVKSSSGDAFVSVSSRCDTTSDGWAAALRDYVIPIVTASGTGANRVRATSQLPSGLASDVRIVTNDSVCTAAYNAHIARNYAGDTTAIKSIALIQVGATRYVLEDGRRRAGEWELLDVYDASFRYLVSITR